jgi:hypothetical protein
MRPISIVFAFMGSWILSCWAAPEEIQVYQDDETQASHWGLDWHFNDTVVGSQLADFIGERSPTHVFRSTPEVYYGLGSGWELGFIPSVHSPLRGLGP